MSLRDDALVLWAMARGQRSRGPQAERLAAFYGPQAERYDVFRERLLHGRERLVRLLVQHLSESRRVRVVELGAGTGRTAAFFGADLARIERLELVDLCVPLLERARARWAGHPDVDVIESDATRYTPDAPVDAAYFSYSLSMIPDWRAALENAVRIVRPGGLVGVVDFTLPRGSDLWSRVARTFWHRWFAHDGVRLDLAHRTALLECTEPVVLEEGRGRVPYLLGLHVPYLVYLGRTRTRA